MTTHRRKPVSHRLNLAKAAASINFELNSNQVIMKDVFRFIFAVVLGLFVQGCIPSLHGIISKDQAEVDDRIVGIWAPQAPSNNNQVEVHFKVETDEGEVVRKKTEAELAKIFGKEKGSRWTFERAGKVVFTSNSEDIHMRMDPGSPSMGPTNLVATVDTLYDFYFLRHEENGYEDTIVSYLKVGLTKIGDQTFMDFKPYPVENEVFQGYFAANYVLAHSFARYDIVDNVLGIEPFDAEYIESLIQNKRVRLKHENIGEDGIILTASTEELRAFISKYQHDPALFDETEVLHSQ